MSENIKWLSVVELARRADVPESTARRYLTRFESYFLNEERSRGRKYHPDSIAVLVRIQSLYAAGAETDEIDQILSREFPMFIEGLDKKEEAPAPPVAPYATHEDFKTLYAALQDLRTEIADVRKENAQLHLYLNKQTDQEELKQMIKQLEEKLEEEQKNEEKKKKPWWKVF